jgi:alpha-galactosidase/6-phospho-beta-glucosidase family protein
VIEVPCQVDAVGPVPLAVSAATGHELGLMSAVRASERDIAAAALLAARAADEPRAQELALRAFATHPLVSSLDAARELAAAALQMSSVPTAPHSTHLSYRYSSFLLHPLAPHGFLQYSY